MFGRLVLVPERLWWLCGSLERVGRSGGGHGGTVDLLQGNLSRQLENGLRSSWGEFGRGFHVAECGCLLREGASLLWRDRSSALSGQAGSGLPVSSQVRLAAHQDDGGGRGQQPQLGQPLVDCTEQGGDVTDLETQQEHVRFTVSELSGIVGSWGAWNVTLTGYLLHYHYYTYSRWWHEYGALELNVLIFTWGIVDCELHPLTLHYAAGRHTFEVCFGVAGVELPTPELGQEGRLSNFCVADKDNCGVVSGGESDHDAGRSQHYWVSHLSGPRSPHPPPHWFIVTSGGPGPSALITHNYSFITQTTRAGQDLARTWSGPGQGSITFYSLSPHLVGTNLITLLLFSLLFSQRSELWTWWGLISSICVLSYCDTVIHQHIPTRTKYKISADNQGTHNTPGICQDLWYFLMVAIAQMKRR